MMLILSIFILTAGFLMLVKPDAWWEITESWKSSNAGNPLISISKPPFWRLYFCIGWVYWHNRVLSAVMAANTYFLMQVIILKVKFIM